MRMMSHRRLMGDNDTSGGQNGEGQLPGTNNLRVVDDSFDPYSFEQETKDPYARDRFYTSSRDKKTGDKGHVQAQIAGAILHEIDALIAEKIVPEYRTRGDFIRDALTHRLHDIGEMKEQGRLSKRLNSFILLMDMEHLQSDVDTSKKVVQVTEVMLASASQSNDWVAVGVALERGFMQLDTLREPYRTQLQEVLRQYETRYNDRRGKNGHPSNS